MTQKDIYSAEQSAAVLDHAPMAVLINAMEDHKLLYANHMAKQWFPGADHLEAVCAALDFGGPPQGQPDHGGVLAREYQDFDSKRIYQYSASTIQWSGRDANISYLIDITEQKQAQQHKNIKDELQNIINAIPGGIASYRVEDNRFIPMFFSNGLAAMLHMSMDEVEQIYGRDALGGIHPEDIDGIQGKLSNHFAQGKDFCELVYRAKSGHGGFIWVNAKVSVKRMSDGVCRLYAVYTDISAAVEEKQQLRRQYEDLILQHYRTLGPDILIVGHCNITQDLILEIRDFTNSNLLETLGTNREEFFTGISKLVVDEKERKTFLDTYLRQPCLDSFAKNIRENTLKSFIRLPVSGRCCYAEFKVNMVEAPDTGEITGILTVTDITEQTISDRILYQISESCHDYIMDVDLVSDYYRMLSCNENACSALLLHGSFSEKAASMLKSGIVPRDKYQFQRALDPKEMYRRLEKENAYTISYSRFDENGDIRTKNMTIFAIEMRLGRACMMCTDITDSIREQQGLLNMIAYTFDLAGLIHVRSRRFIMHTRQTILENLSPYVMEDYNHSVKQFTSYYGSEEDMEEVEKQFSMETMMKRLSERPGGYDFVFPYRCGEGLLYKQINVLWGDQNHKTISVVRADVTEMLAAERQAQKALEKALALAEKANQAKSEFLSAMSHDIRTPMNAIMGMTSLAMAYLDDRNRVEEYLRKISVSSKHLLSLINDVLDMSKIERSRITLNVLKVSLPELMQEISAIISHQARTAGLSFDMRTKAVIHKSFYGDSLRISQILINILSNAVKFTPSGGSINFFVEEIPAVREPDQIRFRFTVQDTGIGMSKEFLTHVFAPFARDVTVSGIEGTGLGLSITRGLIDLMEGDISIESEVNKGSKFCVELEFQAAGEDAGFPDKTEEKYKIEEDVFSGRCFLIAEDNEINAEIMSELLGMYGARCVIETDGLQTVQAFRNADPGTYDAILMDIQMPGMNGYEAACAIRALSRPDAGLIPIIAMTANAFSEDIRAAMDAGMNAHVAKPIDMAVLRQTLAMVMGRAMTSAMLEDGGEG